MTKDRFERRAYRRSPGRQYGYDYDPLHSNRSGASQSGRLDTSSAGEQWSSRGGIASQGTSRPTLQLAQRPDLRRTRQLLRQNILAGKSHSTTLHEDEMDQQDDLMLPSASIHAQHPLNDEDQNGYDEHEDSTLFSNRYRIRNNRPIQPPLPETEEYIESGGEEGEWDELAFVDPDAGYEDPFDHRFDPPQGLSVKPLAPRPSARRRDPEYDYDEDEYEEEEAPVRRKGKKKRRVSRRKLLVALGVAAAGGVAAIELGPKIPEAIHDAGNNIERQIEDAYHKGLAAGAEAVRKEFITSLESLEGISLQGAIAAAKLTRLAYDAFVSPLVTLAATITGDFFSVILQALQIGRGWLARINQDNSTLAALQTVLQTWVKQAKEMPKELQSITDSDLDGAQAYLRALQRKIQEEQAKLNGQSTPTPRPTATPKPKH